MVFQPFDRWWMGSDTLGRVDGRRSPVLLVSGYACNRGQWWWLRRRLRARGFAVGSINLLSRRSRISIASPSIYTTVSPRCSRKPALTA